MSCGALEAIGGIGTAGENAKRALSSNQHFSGGRTAPELNASVQESTENLMRKVIPGAVLSVCAEIAARRETHASLGSLFTDAGAPRDPPPGSKATKALEWLRRCNKAESVDPLCVLGRVLENYLEAPLDSDNPYDAAHLVDRNKLVAVLANAELKYIGGGQVVGTLASPSRSLDDYIRHQDIRIIDQEFDRALTSVEFNPRDAVSAASNVLESVCKVYIDDEKLEMPAKQDLRQSGELFAKTLATIQVAPEIRIFKPY